MSAVQSEVDICNLALSGMGNRTTVTNITTPTNDKEIVFSKWYHPVRQYCLKKMMPNFALDRVYVSQKAVPAGYVNSYLYCYEKPSYALKVLGVGEIDQKDYYNYIIEGDNILTNDAWENDAMLIRIIRDWTDVPTMTIEFVMDFVAELRKRTTFAITQDPAKVKAAMAEIMLEEANTTALNAQENRPVRRSVSRFRLARNYYQSMNIPKR